VPEKRFACAAFGNSTTAAPIHQRLHDFVLHDLLQLPPAARLTQEPVAVDASRYTGRYEKQYATATVSDGAGETLTLTLENHYDDEQRELFKEYAGRETFPPMPLYPVTATFFVPGAPPAEPLPVSRMSTGGLTFLDPYGAGRYRYVSSGFASRGDQIPLRAMELQQPDPELERQPRVRILQVRARDLGNATHAILQRVAVDAQLCGGWAQTPHVTEVGS